MSRLFFGIIIWGFISPLWGQVVNIRGQVIDQATDEPVPFVNIRLNNFYYGTSTNLEGRFELKLSPERFEGNDQLRITAIGYKTRTLKLHSIDPNRYQTIKLIPQTTQLGQVVVKSARARRKESIKAKTVVMRALDRIPENRAKGHFMANAFYRHYCKEDDQYVRLIEAGLDIYQHRKDRQFVQIPEQKLAFNVTQLRRSFDFTASAKLRHTHFSLNFLLANDLTAYEFHNPLRRKLDDYEFSFADTTVLDNEQVIVIDFESKEEVEGKRYFEGTLYLDMLRLAFLRADIKARMVRHSELDSVRSEIHKRIFFQKIDQSIYPSRVVSDLEATHFSLDSLTGLITDQVRHEAHVELMTNNIVPKSKTVLVGAEPSKRQLRKITYDSVFWHNYTVLQATPLEEKIIKDLSERLELEKQFEAFNRLEEGSQSVIAMEEFKTILGEHQGTPVYVVIWAGWSPPNYYEMISSPDLRRLLKREKIQLLMVSLDTDDSEWELNRDLNGLNLPGIRHHRLNLEFGSEVTRKFFQAALPAYILFDAEGQVYDQEPPLPNAAEVKGYYSDLINGEARQSSTKR